MSFRLLIECSKDLDSIQIDFSDGTSVVKSSNEKQLNSDKPLDLDYDNDSVESVVVEKPLISLPENRVVNVANELQNLDF